MLSISSLLSTFSTRSSGKPVRDRMVLRFRQRYFSSSNLLYTSLSSSPTKCSGRFFLGQLSKNLREKDVSCLEPSVKLTVIPNENTPQPELNRPKQLERFLTTLI